MQLFSTVLYQGGPYYEVTLCMDSASRLTLPVVMPATEIRPSLVAYTENYMID